MARAIVLTPDFDALLSQMEQELNATPINVINHAMTLFMRAMDAAKRGNSLAEIGEGTREVLYLEILKPLYDNPPSVPKPRRPNLKLVSAPVND